MAMAVLVVTVGTGAQQAAQSSRQQAGSSAPALPPAAGTVSNSSPPVPSSRSETPNPDAVNAEQKKQIADESAKMLKLATDLKSEVDKTTKDTLSITVIRKADEIEKLAHAVKEQMRVTVGPE